MISMIGRSLLFLFLFALWLQRFLADTRRQRESASFYLVL
jgi:hypothetical protein